MFCQLVWLRLLKPIRRPTFYVPRQRSFSLIYRKNCHSFLSILNAAENNINYTKLIRGISTEKSVIDNLSPLQFDEICTETLESLFEYFEELAESAPELKNADITYSDGVITANLGALGTYVINRQTPNKQIWLSSPTSGPKRYDFTSGLWIYKHDQTSLHSLLDSEISLLLKQQVEFSSRCNFGNKDN